VLGTADVLEDLLLLGALEGKVVIGSMNRGGLADTVFEIDDQFTRYDAPAIARMGFEQVMAALTLPALLLGGEVPDDPSPRSRAGKALRLPDILGLVAGRSLLYPADDDVAGAVDTAVGLL
jgi:hypothetical protein